MFQSTRPRRGAIENHHVISVAALSFNPRAPGGARSNVFNDFTVCGLVSIHAPPEGRDDRLSPGPLQP